MTPQCEKAVAAYQAGDWGRTEALCLRILSSEKADPAILHILGLVRSRQGRYGEALAFLDAALAEQPQSADILANRGLVLQFLQRPGEALDCFDRAHALMPGLSLQLQRGSALMALARYEEAAACFSSVLGNNPNDVTALRKRSNALLCMGHLNLALADCDAMLALAPHDASAWNDRGNILNRMMDLDAALKSLEQALAIKPDMAIAHFNRGAVLQALNRSDEALASYDRALSISPEFSEALNNRGVLLRYLNRFAQAAANFEQALALNPDNRYALGGLADCFLNLCDWKRREEITDKLKSAIRDGKKIIPPLTLLGYCDDPGLQQSCARNYMKEMATKSPALVRARLPRGPHKKIRIAYLSADFHEHATSFLMAELFARHDRNRFKVVAISYGASDESTMRARLVASFDEFHDVREKSDEIVANLLQELEIDIAIDLKGHTLGGRPCILRDRPCPIQVNYLGYPGTMGADFIDYIIADSCVLPPGMEPFFDETIIRLDGCYQANPNTRVAADEMASRQSHGLPENGFIFCCFNSGWKISPDLFAVWMRLLRAVPGSILWLLEDNAEAKENLRTHAVNNGVDPSRLVFAPRMPQEAHLARHRLADLFLDTSPYNAHTTASDALWMGLPVITSPGRTFPSRVAASLLAAAELPELVADNLDEYEKLARDLAHDRKRLHSIKQKLESNRLSAPLFDTQTFRIQLEEAYIAMWKKSQNFPD